MVVRLDSMTPFTTDEDGPASASLEERVILVFPNFVYPKLEHSTDPIQNFLLWGNDLRLFIVDFSTAAFTSSYV